MTASSLNPEQRRLLAPFVREYERAKEHATAVQQQAMAAVQQAETQAREAGARLLRAGALALDGRTDLAVDWETYEVQETSTAVE